ncbi:MAG TPA: 50S ribosomal protein L23 [Methylomirabilota bacterium]|nr:50S ribosomal protein L23 [Methylomirabilota bacterium]
MNSIIVKPLITEASMKAVDAGKFSFVVVKHADKEMIKKVVNELFNVHVVSVATSVLKGRTKRVGKRRTEIKDAAWKKAIVTLTKGEKISWFEPGGGEEPKK